MSRSIWFRPVSPKTLKELERLAQNTLLAHLGIRLVEVGPDFLRGEMPVDSRTRQPYGLLHGGASVALAESLASCAGNLVLDSSKFHAVGLEINANHISSCRDGEVVGTARAVHLGKTTQVWETTITQGERLVCLSRMTLAVLEKRPSPPR
jgi:1,4-dihydroxy-2-naphthoyl-CoA hydrolase